MAKVYESNKGRRGDHRQLQVDWIVDGTADQDVADETAARAAALAAIPTTIAQNVNGVVHWLFNVNLTSRVREYVYMFTATYASPQAGGFVGAANAREDLEPPANELPATTIEWTFSWDTTGFTRTIKQSYGTKAFDNTGTAQPSLNNLHEGQINVVADGDIATVEGTEKVTSGLRFQITGRMLQSSLTTDYVDAMARLTGRTNDASFPPTNEPFVNHSWPAGFVLFLGGHGSYSSEGTADVDLHFEVSRSEVFRWTDPDGMLPSKKICDLPPHNFVWQDTSRAYNYATDEYYDKINNTFVETLYLESDFTKLLNPGATKPPDPT